MALIIKFCCSCVKLNVFTPPDLPVFQYVEQGLFMLIRLSFQIQNSAFNKSLCGVYPTKGQQVEEELFMYRDG